MYRTVDRNYKPNPPPGADLSAARPGAGVAHAKASASGAERLGSELRAEGAKLFEGGELGLMVH